MPKPAETNQIAGICKRVATVSVFLTVGFSPARCSSGTLSIWREYAATVALSNVSLL